MIKRFINIVFLFLSVSIMGQLNPQSKKITEKFFPDSDSILEITPALQKKRGFTDYDELLTFLNNLVTNHPTKIKLSFIGESQKGRKIPMVHLTNPNQNQKIKVWIQGGLHGNEIASTEGVLYLLDRLLNDATYTKILDNVDLAIVPMANIDGYLKVDRYSANGLDLNRDQTKLMAPESIVLKQAFTNFNPEVGLDFHEYKPYRKDFARLSSFGVASLYDAMFLYSGNLNVPENIRKLTDEVFVENARIVLDKNKFTHRPYVSTGKFSGEIHFNQGSNNARSSATNYALTNTISTLVEIRGVDLGRTSLKRRIHILFLIATSFLETSIKEMETVKNEIKKAVNQNNDLIVKSKKSIYKDQIKAIDLDTEEIIDLDVTIRDALQSKPVLIRKRPKAYLIEGGQTEIIEKLRTLGAEIEILPEDKEINVETFVIETYDRDKIKYEKMNLQKVDVKLIENKKLFKKGTFKILMNQKRANIIAEVLEPEAPNSFVSFGVLETSKGATLPIYRIPN